MVRDAAATRSRILDAAVEEFAAYGLAGARIDRIAENASANKRALYEHFESKEGLFGAALERVISDLVRAVPLTEDDLPGYAGRVFDYTLEHPEAMRMNLWRKLERPALGPDLGADHGAKVRAITEDDGSSASGLPPADLLVLIYGVANAWFINPDDLLTADGSDPRSPERLAVHRAALVEAARRLVAPAPDRSAVQ